MAAHLTVSAVCQQRLALRKMLGSSSVEPLPYDKLPATGGSRQVYRLPML